MSNESQESGEIKLEKELNLQADFPIPSYEDWKAAAGESLKGAPFEKKLVTQTYEGIDLQPIYTSNDIGGLPHLGEKPGYNSFSRGTTANGYLAESWEICQEIFAPLPSSYNEALKYDLKRGQTAINLCFDNAASRGVDPDNAGIDEVGKNGVTISTSQDMSTALSDVDFERCPIHIRAGFSPLEPLMLLKAAAHEQGIDISKTRGSIHGDPLGYWVTNGQIPVQEEDAFDRMAQAAHWTAKNAPGLRTIGISGLPYHNAGADAARELAYALGTAVEYMDRLLKRGLDADSIAQNMHFTFGVGPFYFMELAKIRAARILWDRITTGFNCSPHCRKMTVHARTSFYNQTKYDPYVNMLRTTTEAFSAVAAGVDSLTTNPFNETYGSGDEFSRRAARNVQVLLNEESRLNRIIDPAGGSYFVEKLTHEVAEKAWKLFQEIETKGGMLNALKQGFPQSETETVDKKRKADLAKRKSMIVGTNFSADVKEKKIAPTFPDYAEIQKQRSATLKKFRDSRSISNKTRDDWRKMLSQLKEAWESRSTMKTDIVEAGAEALAAGATLGEISSALRVEKTAQIPSASITPLTPRRQAEIFEELRDAVESFKEKTDSTAGPKLFLATMGPLAQHKPRADFSQSFFEIAGFNVIYPPAPGFNTPQEAIDAAIASQAPVVAICSTDETYPELVPPIAKSLKEKNPAVVVVLAGFPKDHVETFKQAGVDEFIYLGGDAHHILSGILKKVGVLS